MMVVLSTVAAAGSAISPLSMLESIGLLVFFLIICFIIGIYFLPTFFKKTRQYFNDETLLIVSLGGARCLFNGHSAFRNDLHAPHQGFA